MYNGCDEFFYFWPKVPLKKRRESTSHRKMKRKEHEKLVNFPRD